jgi:hypothetical protein
METSHNVEEVSLSDIFKQITLALKFLLHQWWKILLVTLIGALIGVWYASTKPTTYTARLTFILEDGKGGTGNLASLAGQFGFDLGGMSGSNGPLSSDNVNLFLKSESLTEETLLTPYDDAGKFSLADKYAEVYNLKTSWRKKVGHEISFPIHRSQPFTRLQDSLLQILIDLVSNKHISINKPDRKASFIEVSTTTKDELLSKYYCERLVSSAIARYIDIRTERQNTNISRLQKRADSISILLNTKTYSSAVAQERTLDINPALRSTSNVPSEVIGRDKVMLSTIYAEIVKNLEVSKVALSQETPVIQIIDNVRLPLKKNVPSKILFGLAGGVCLGFLISFLFVGQFLIKQRSKLLPQRKEN